MTKRLLVISGLPGVGKTAVAAAVAGATGAVHLSIDAVEDALLDAGLTAGWTVGVAAYEAVGAMAGTNLALGHPVVVDAVNDSAAARRTWQVAADSHAASLHLVHLICSDSDEHRRRLTGRTRGLVHVTEPSWADVRRRAEQYPPWAQEHLQIDTAQMSLPHIARRIHDHDFEVATNP